MEGGLVLHLELGVDGVIVAGGLGAAGRLAGAGGAGGGLRRPAVQRLAQRVRGLFKLAHGRFDSIGIVRLRWVAGAVDCPLYRFLVGAAGFFGVLGVKFF